MNLKEHYTNLQLNANLNDIILNYGYSLSMFEELECDYQTGYRLLCYSSIDLRNIETISIYKHALFGIVVCDRRNKKLFINSNKKETILNHCKKLHIKL